MAKISYSVNQKSLMAEIAASDPVLKRVMDEVMEESFFNPAVEQLKEDFDKHDITNEIRGGIDADNLSNTLQASFNEDGSQDSKPNLTSFIGFDQDPASVLSPILIRLDSRHPDGPKMIYNGRDGNKLVYKYEIKAPNTDAIYAETSLPWAEGISWTKRIEQGIPGIAHFLNVKDRPSSRSGGGIQIKGNLRSGTYKPTSYLSKIFNNFLRRVVGRKDNGRSV